MKQELFVGLSIQDAALQQEVETCLASVEGLRTLSAGPAVPPSDQPTLDVLVFQDDRDTDQSISEISSFRAGMPETSIFVISTNKSPEHVVEVMKAGAEEFFSNSLNPQALIKALEKVRQRLLTAIKPARGRLYSFISAKGGLGATVISVNIAAALALRSKSSVALLDMSLQSGDSSVYLDTLPQTTLADICKNFHRLDYSFLKTSMLRHSTGLHYLAAPHEPEDSGSVHGLQVKKVLQLAKSLYDHVIVDCTSMLIDECSLEAFQASDRIFILTDLSVPAVRNAARLNQLMQKLSISPSKVEIAVNRFTKSGTPLVDMEKILKKDVYWLFPNDFEEVITSINTGVPLVKGKPGSSFAKNILEFIEKLQNSASHAGYRGARGFLGKAI